MSRIAQGRSMQPFGGLEGFSYEKSFRFRIHPLFSLCDHSHFLVSFIRGSTVPPPPVLPCPRPRLSGGATSFRARLAPSAAKSTFFSRSRSQESRGMPSPHANMQSSQGQMKWSLNSKFAAFRQEQQETFPKPVPICKQAKFAVFF